MEKRTEVAKKTPGDIEREKLAGKELKGEGWEFYRNYLAVSRESVEYNKVGDGKITSDLEIQKRNGQIEDWRASMQAFEDNGKAIPCSQGLAAYIKPKAQVR